MSKVIYTAIFGDYDYLEIPEYVPDGFDFICFTDTNLESDFWDVRVGHSHLNVPGHDGKYGFGGSCFPKDIQALIKCGDEFGVDMSVLKGSWKTNLKVRPERDWEQLKGRAVVDE
jgi:UDPglucose 6-dehydrogenase